ncbi:hypothetical protein LCGC14_1725820 [marine sediment metagenome]|uniref:Uncharacterized protein n=1 Tax=marine sediment metagenome TaxID=412755 RepID=A0A0F9HYT3_9ZZZZ
MWFLLVLMGLLLVACNPGPRYTEPPHPSWKERFQYCYYIVADPFGDRNTRHAWADSVEDLAGVRSKVRMLDVRVSPILGSLRDAGKARKDFYSPEVIWTVEDGSLEVIKRAHCGGEGETLE